jgi:hypothetical protein
MTKHHNPSGLEENHYDFPEEEEEKKSPLRIIFALFLILLLILMIVPSYVMRMNPEPKNLDKIDIPIFNITNPLTSFEEVRFLSVTQTTRNAAILITSQACKDTSRVCFAKALFYYTRDNIAYLHDPTAREYIQSPEETLAGAGDCEDQSILLYMLMKSIGITPRLVLVPGHAYIEILLPEASDRYKEDNGWISLDTTCKSCGFGKILSEYRDAEKKYSGF